MDLVGIHSDSDLSRGETWRWEQREPSGSGLVGQVQIDLSAHQLGNLNLSAQVAVGMLFQELLVVLDVLGTDADLRVLPT